MGNTIWNSEINHLTFSERLRKIFELSENEIILDKFSCALIDGILIQGELYVTPNRLIFHSIFNKKTLIGDTRVKIEYNDISYFKKERGIFGLNNTLYIETIQNKHAFTSFIFRDACFELIQKSWLSYLNSILPLASLDVMNGDAISSIQLPDDKKPESDQLSEERLIHKDHEIEDIDPARVKIEVENDNDNQEYLEKLALRKTKVMQNFPNIEKYSLSAFKITVSNTDMSQFFKIIFEDNQIKIREENYSNLWEVFTKRSEIKESPMITSWTPSPPNFQNSKEVLDFNFDHIKRTVRTKKAFKGAAALLAGRFIDYEDFQTLYIVENKELILFSDIKFHTKLPFSDVFQFNSIWIIQETEKNEVTLEQKYYIDFLKPNLMRGMIEKNIVEEQKEFGKNLEGIIQEFQEAGLFEIQPSEMSKHQPKKV